MRFIFYFLILFPTSIFSQISLISENLSIGEPIKVVGTEEVIGLQNGLTNNSIEIDFGTHSLSLGSIQEDGIYAVTYSLFNDSIYTQLFFAIDGEINVLEKGKAKITFAEPNKKAIYDKISTFFKSRSKEDYIEIMKFATKEYALNNPVTLTTNLVCYISTVAQPLIVPICNKLSYTNLKDFGLQVIKSTLLQMKNKLEISNDEYDTYISSIDTFEDIISLINPDELKSKPVEYICSNLDKLKTEYGEMEIILNYTGQLCNSVNTLVDLNKIK